jgi:glycine betaine/choline ABC-type transport system substrate-binding protein
MAWILSKVMIGRPRRWILFVCATAVLTLVSTCPPALQAASKPTVTVGSKNFTEELIVGELEALLLQNAGYHVNLKLNLGGTIIAHQALLRGDIDTYVEYTGTGLTAILKLPVVTNPQTVYAIVAREYHKRFKLTWLKPWGFNDTYALVMRKDRAAKLGVKDISALRRIASTLTLGATHEFVVRPDGLPGLAKKYGGLTFKAVRGMDPGIMYQALASGQVDVISGFSTDGRIPALKLVPLVDDKHFFPPYFAAPVVRDSTLARAPGIATVLNKLAGKISDNTMARLNRQVDLDKKDPAAVARAFLKQEGLIT